MIYSKLILDKIIEKKRTEKHLQETFTTKFI